MITCVHILWKLNYCIKYVHHYHDSERWQISLLVLMEVLVLALISVRAWISMQTDTQCVV